MSLPYPLVLEAAKHLHLKEHTVCDSSRSVFKLAALVEGKGIVGSHNRRYLLDRMRVTPRDANYTGPGSRFCILRPELVTAFYQAEVAERRKRKGQTWSRFWAAEPAASAPDTTADASK